MITIITIRYHSNRKNISPNNTSKNEAYYLKSEDLNLDKKINAEAYEILNHLVDNGSEDDSK